MEVEDIMGLTTQKLYWQFTKVYPPCIMRIHLQRLFDWCDSSKLEDVAQRIENAMLDIRGGDIYYDIVLLSTHSTHPIIMAAIEAAKWTLLTLASQ